MTDTTTRRRGHGEDAIYFDPAKNRYVGAVSLGSGPGGKRMRRKVTGRTKQEVRDKLKAHRREAAARVGRSAEAQGSSAPLYSLLPALHPRQSSTVLAWRAVFSHGE